MEETSGGATEEGSLSQMPQNYTHYNHNEIPERIEELIKQHVLIQTIVASVQESVTAGVGKLLSSLMRFAFVRLDVADGEAAGTGGCRWGWRSFLMSCGTQRFKELSPQSKQTDMFYHIHS